MAFDSLGAFIAMEGHGPYVWTCYGVFFLLLGSLVYWSLRQRRQVMVEQRRVVSRDSTARTGAGQPATGASFQRVNEPKKSRD
jgi:heme exporter protein D